VVIVVACGRSGTRFASRLAQSAGLDFGHERIGDDGAIGWPLALHANLLRGRRVWHQVREPLAAIGSLTTHTEGVWGPVESVLGHLPATPLLRAADYWIRWNERCETLAEWTYRVEDLAPGTETLARWCQGLGIDAATLEWPPRDDNHRRHAAVMWKDLPQPAARIVRRLARRYGYET